MKKVIFLASMLVALYAFTGVSQAIIINSGPFGGKYTDFTFVDFDQPNISGLPLTPGQIIDGTPSGNVWGMFSMTGIHTLLDNNPESNSLSGVAYYSPGSDGKYYFGVYGGLSYISGTAPGMIRLGADDVITPYLKIYETTFIGLYDAAAIAGPNIGGEGAFGTFGQNIIYGPDGVAGGGDDSALWLDTTFSLNTLSAYDGAWPGLTPAEKLELELITNSSSVTGSAESYLDIKGGTGAALFERGVFDMAGTLTGDDRADLKVISDITTQFEVSSGLWTNPFGWTSNSQDPITGVGANPVPEPSTIILLGAGLLGIGFFGRRRMNK